MTAKEVAHKIRKGELDCNVQQLFFSSLIKALLINLRESISIRKIPVPHIIMNTGDDTMWLMAKGYDVTIEPTNISNECTIYNTVPRCVCNPSSIDMVPDQLTSPYTTGVFQFEYENSLYTFHSEFRRMPVKLQVNLKYYLDSFTDALELMQHVCTKLAFIRTYKFTYMGQTITASYRIPDSMEDQHMTELSGDLTDSRDRTVEVSLEVESFIPVYAPKTVQEATYISQPITNTKLDNHETVTRNLTARSGYRGHGSRKY